MANAISFLSDVKSDVFITGFYFYVSAREAYCTHALQCLSRKMIFEIAIIYNLFV